jgi:putative DNA primase/helicase
MGDPYNIIAGIIDAAAPAPTAEDILAELAASANAAKPHKDRKSAAASGRPSDPSSSSGEEGASAQPSRDEAAASAVPPAASFSSRSEGEATETPSDPPPIDDELDREEPIAEALAYCADLDENDVDNGKRIRRYFRRDLLAIAQSGQAIGAFVRWSGMHWDVDGGLAGAQILAQRIGDLIVQEADFLAYTDFDRMAMAAAEAALPELQQLIAKEAGAKRKKKDPADTARRKELEAIIKKGERAENRLISRKIARREFANASKNMARIRNMLDAAGPHLRKPPEAFNVDALLLATRTHTLRFDRSALMLEAPEPGEARFTARVIETIGHRRSDMLTCMVPVDYRPKLKGERWEKFINRALPEAEKRRTVQAFAGLGLTGLPVQRLMYHFGAGANGKSVFLEVITRLLGDSFAVGLPVESVTGMTSGTGAQASPDVARLYGKRMLRVHELPPGGLLRAEMIKKLTGGEKMTARDLYKGFFEFQPRAKTHMSGNDFPNFDGSDGGMRRRLIVIHWTQVIPESEQRDFEEFVSELLLDGPAILNWLIEGALDYLRNGLFVAEEVRTFTESYFDEMDPAGQFVSACLAEEREHHEKARDVYNAYTAWSEANAKKPMTEARFGRIMKKKITRDDTKRVHMYMNVRLHDVPERPSEHASHDGAHGGNYGPEPPPAGEISF